MKLPLVKGSARSRRRWPVNSWEFTRLRFRGGLDKTRSGRAMVPSVLMRDYTAPKERFTPSPRFWVSMFYPAKGSPFSRSMAMVCFSWRAITIAF
jgi:hypothetical protein